MNDIPIETVSEMLRNANICLSQHYAETLEKKLDRNMDMLRKNYIGD